MLLFLSLAFTVAACSGAGSIGSDNSGEQGSSNDENPVSNGTVALAAEPADELIKSSLLDYYAKARADGGFGDGADGLFLPEVLEQEANLDSSDSSSSTSSSVGDRFSGTNVQEQGVDESDRVKVDGDILFSLEKLGGFITPLVSTNEGLVVAPELIDGLSIAPRLQGETLNAYRLDANNSAVLSRTQLELGSHTPEGMYLHGTGADRELVVLSRGSFDVWGLWYDTVAWGGLTTRVSWLDAGDAANISSARELEVDGQLISSRKIDNRLILVTRYSPQPPGLIVYPYQETDLENNRDVIAQADADDLLPAYRMIEDGVSTENELIVTDNQCYSTRDQSESSLYPTPNIISIITIDLDSNDLQMRSSCFVGESETMYVSTESLYLATTRYDYQIAQDSFDRPFIVDYQPEISTDIHKFSLQNGTPEFKGSSSIPGHLGWYPDRKPYRMSETDGNLRVVSFDQNRDGSPVTLTVLAEGQDSRLRTVATLPNASRPGHIGKEGENLYASRFIGDRGYLVTFRVTDPLYVLDLSNPADPRIAGELELPGYSDYLHPVNENLLLGVGKDAIADNGNGWGDGRGAWYQGVKLALFDVSDPANPSTADSRVIGKRGTDSPALSQPHSFAWLPGLDGRNARLAMPLSLHDGARGFEGEDPSQPWAWADWTSNNLLTMEVNEASNTLEEVSDWVFESKVGGYSYSPVGLYDDRAIIGAGGDLYVVHNGTLYYGQWGSDAPTSAAQ